MGWRDVAWLLLLRDFAAAAEWPARWLADIWAFILAAAHFGESRTLDAAMRHRREP